jgi:hypothetical protein
LKSARRSRKPRKSILKQLKMLLNGAAFEPPENDIQKDMELYFSLKI